MSLNSEIDIANLPLRALLRNAEVLRFFKLCTETLATQAKLNTSALYSLSEENASLTLKLAEMQRRVEAMEGNRLPPEYPFPSPPTVITKLPSEASLSPSDSVSQRGYEDAHPMAFPAALPLIQHPNKCPADFSPAVLWTLQECHMDPSACRGKRINLSTAIRDKDGKPVRNLPDIKRTARFHFLSSMLNLPIPLHAPKRQTGLWWKTYRPDEWKAAIQYLEVSHPVVAYCAHHWKAEEIFRVVIQTRLDSERAKNRPKRQEKARGSQNAGPAGAGTATTSLKRPHSAISNPGTGPSPSLE